MFHPYPCPGISYESSFPLALGTVVLTLEHHFATSRTGKAISAVDSYHNL